MLIVVTAFVLLMGGLAFSFHQVVLDRLADLEVETIHRDLDRIVDLIGSDLLKMDSTAKDWASWDETYQFVQNRNEQYIVDNLSPDTLTNLEFNFLVLMDNSNQIVWDMAVDRLNGSETPTPPALIELLDRWPAGETHQGAEDPMRGLVVLPEGPTLVVSRPILKNDNSGPAQGTLFFGRYLDAEELERIKRITHIQTSIFSATGPKSRLIAPEVSAGLDRQQNYMTVAASGLIEAYTKRQDVFGRPTVIIKVESPRKLYRHGLMTFNFLLLWLVGITVVVILLTLFSLDRMVLSPLVSLSNRVDDIAGTGDSTRRLTWSGRDELSNLAQKINGMLDALEQTRLQQAEIEQYYRAVVEDQTEFILRFLPSGEIIFANQAFCRHLGLEWREIKEQKINAVLDEELVQKVTAMALAIDAEKPRTVIQQNLESRGEKLWINWIFKGLFDSSNRLTQFQAVGRDVTHLKQTEEKLTAALRDKDVLLHEIHHRVKNNMQVIMSLINLQMHRITDSEMLDLFTDTQLRITAMALVHDNLLMSAPSLASINLGDYLQNLVKTVTEAYDVSGGRVNVELHTDNILLNMEQAVPCGLIVNELVTNSLKYAFPDHGSGVILISAQLLDQGKVTIEISDNGVGFPQTTPSKQAQGLGLKLVMMLAEGQLGATVDLDGRNGAKFTMLFDSHNHDRGN
jgi:PAS domain S-box-containing protein